MGSCVSSACVVTGVAARRIATAVTGLETTTTRRGKNDSSAYCRIPRGGSRRLSWRPPRRRFAVGFCARASYPIRYCSADSAHSSYEDAPPGASDSCRSVVASVDAAKFPDNWEQCRECDLPRLHEVRVRVSGRFRKIVPRDEHACRGRSLVVHPCFTVRAPMCIDVLRCIINDNDNDCPIPRCRVSW